MTAGEFHARRVGDAGGELMGAIVTDEAIDSPKNSLPRVSIESRSSEACPQDLPNFTRLNLRRRVGGRWLFPNCWFDPIHPSLTPVVP
jgi:hypothetical protein